MKRYLMIALLALTACGTPLVANPPAGSPPLSPRETALQIDQEYALVQTAVLNTIRLPALSAAAKKQVAAASDVSTTALLTYSHQADNCFRDPATGIVGNAPGKVCNQSAFANAFAIAWAEIGQVNGLIAAFAPSLAVHLPTSAPQ